MIEISRKFNVFMDSGRMLQLFQQKLPDCQSGALHLTSIAIQHPRFKTYLNPASRQKSFLALVYHLSGFNKSTDENESLILYAKAYLGSRSLPEFRRAYEEAEPNLKQTIMHFDDYGLVAWMFPTDPALPWLGKILNNKFISNYFAGFLLPKSYGMPSIIKDTAIYIVNYRPELRCTCRYEVQRMFHEPVTLYGKTFFDDHGGEIYRRAAYLQQRSKNNPAGFAIAEPIGYDASIHTIWMKGLAGQCLTEAFKHEKFELLITQLAGCLADFHNGEIDGIGSITEESQMAEIRKKAVKLKQAFPLQAERIEKLIVMLAQQKKDLPKVPDKLIHGDFHIKQLLLLADKRIALFDYDELAMANPLIDIANFCADLFNQDLPEHLVQSITERFFSDYQKKSRLELNQNHFHWHLRIQLLTRAYRAFIQQKPDMAQSLNRFLNLAESGF
jgi:hypothetical protein